jgi:hypothetical protein
MQDNEIIKSDISPFMLEPNLSRSKQNAARERLAHASVNKGRSSASPLQSPLALFALGLEMASVGCEFVPTVSTRVFVPWLPAGALKGDS